MEKAIKQFKRLEKILIPYGFSPDEKMIAHSIFEIKYNDDMDDYLKLEFINDLKSMYDDKFREKINQLEIDYSSKINKNRKINIVPC